MVICVKPTEYIILINEGKFGCNKRIQLFGILQMLLSRAKNSSA